MTLHLSLPGSHQRSNEQQAELREARRLLRDKVKNDWEYPTLPKWTSSGRRNVDIITTREVEDRIAGFKFHSSATGLDRTNGVMGEAFGLGFEPTEWREREVSEASDTEGESEAAEAKAAASRKATKSKDSVYKFDGPDSVYKFDGPDSVGTQLNERRVARKRKRHHALHEEMEWNDGLAHWMKRRDLWCCARETRDVRILQESTAADPSNDKHSRHEEEIEETGSTSATDGSTPRTSTSSAEPNEQSTPGSTPSGTPDADMVDKSGPATVEQMPLDILLPIAPPLLPNHPVRRRITPNMYPEIYNKIILQSRTPSVPLNLLTLIHALVQGWKDDGEWPPKGGPLEKSIGRKKGTGGHEGGSLSKGVKAVGRVLRLTGTGHGNGEGG